VHKQREIARVLAKCWLSVFSPDRTDDPNSYYGHLKITQFSLEFAERQLHKPNQPLSVDSSAPPTPVPAPSLDAAALPLHFVIPLIDVYSIQRAIRHDDGRIEVVRKSPRAEVKKRAIRVTVLQPGFHPISGGQVTCIILLHGFRTEEVYKQAYRRFMKVWLRI